MFFKYYGFGVGISSKNTRYSLNIRNVRAYACLAGLMVCDCLGAGLVCAQHYNSSGVLTHGNREQLDDLAAVVLAGFICSSSTFLLLFLTTVPAGCRSITGSLWMWRFYAGLILIAFKTAACWVYINMQIMF